MIALISKDVFAQRICHGFRVGKAPVFRPFPGHRVWCNIIFDEKSKKSFFFFFARYRGSYIPTWEDGLPRGRGNVISSSAAPAQMSPKSCFGSSKPIQVMCSLHSQATL